MQQNLNEIACVTGATGLIGKYIVRRLIDKGYQVRGLSRTEIDTENRLEWFKGDLLDPMTISNFLCGACIVFHCAAELRNESSMWKANVEGTQILIDAAEREGVKFFCYLSSAGVVGMTTDSIIDEKTPCKPNTQYEQSKWEAEKLVMKAFPNGRVVALRPTNVVDEGRPGIVASVLNCSFADKVKVFVKGAEKAHLVYADDVAAAAVYLIDVPIHEPSSYFVSCDEEPENTVAGIMELCRGVKPVHLPVEVPWLLRRLIKGYSIRGDVIYSCDKLKNTGFYFSTGIVKGVRKIAILGCAYGKMP
ncbi:MAG: NAD-dependent epimerase/dehydratase family protein [Negativicutes bacterium]